MPVNESPTESNTTLSTTALHKTMATIIAVAVPLAAFLAFSIQPLIGKHLLPLYGGTVGSWLGTMLFFQFALLLGYAWAAWLVHRPPSFQVYITVAIGILALVLFRLPAMDTDSTGSILWILWSLSVTALPAMLLLFSVSTLTHGWLHARNQAVPYYLYAFSNIGSLSALILYPFLIEPFIGISEQSFYWIVLLFVLVCLLAIAGLAFLRLNEAPPNTIHASTTKESIDLQSAFFWLGLSALTCTAMLGATHHIAVEIGSSPLSWTGPFGLYLLSFAIIFSGLWRSWMTKVCIAWLGISLAGYMLSKGFSAATVNGPRFWWLLSLTAAGSFLGNAVLYSLKPKTRYEAYYLIIAAGGVLGGLLSSVIIPHILSRPIEFIIATLLLLLMGIFWLIAKRDSLSNITIALVITAPVIGIGLQQESNSIPEGITLEHSRDLYGHVILNKGENSLVISSETTTHGSQFTSDAASRLKPTLYYTESTAVGRILEMLKQERSTINVGVIGLGAGTIAAYAEKGDRFDFWDIDPKSLRIAQENFSFIADAPEGSINIFQSDGRKGLKNSPIKYDAIIIDAFSGDGVPAHLLTREALAIYMNKLVYPNGILLLHATSRYSQMFPVVSATANSLDWSAMNIVTEISASLNDRDWDPTTTEYIAIVPQQQINRLAEWFDYSEDNGRVKRILKVANPNDLPRHPVWTDERHSVLEILDIDKFLFE